MKKPTGTSFLSAIFTLAIVCCLSWSSDQKPVKGFYQLGIYHYSSSDQENILDSYFQNALLPALHRMKISHVGVFKAIANDTSASKSLYVFIPLSSLDLLTKIPEKLQSDDLYQKAGSEYINAVYTSPPYERMETILLRPFPLAPQLEIPRLEAAKKDRVYELRSYESATENIFRNKVKMFNEGDEIGLFKKLGFNAAFYSEVIAGSKMPNLMYMTCFENKADRDDHWKKFSADPYWKQLSSLPEYQHNVSHIDVSFLRPADYSDF